MGGGGGLIEETDVFDDQSNVMLTILWDHYSGWSERLKVTTHEEER